MKTTECIQAVLDDEAGCFIYERKRQQPDFKLDWSDVEIITEKPCFKEFKKQEVNYTVSSTIYKNESNMDQWHNLRVERQLSSVCESYLTKGCIIGFEVEIPFPAAGPIGFWPRFSLKSGKANVHEKYTMVVQDSLKVPTRSSVVVSIKAKQKRKECTFTTLIGFKGKVRGTFIHPTTQSKREFAISLRTIFCENPELLSVTKEENGVSYIAFAGKCNFKYNMPHEVIINTRE